LARKLVRSPGLILVDDVDLGSQGVVKGHLVVPWLESQEIPYEIVRREGEFYSTGVLKVRV
jgi:hypothetical protein